MQSQKELTAREAGDHSRIVATDWAEEYSDLLCVFNADKLNRSLFGLFSTTHRENQPVEYDELCRGFLQLVDTGVLVPEFKSSIADEQLDEMRQRFTPQTVSSVQTHNTAESCTTRDPSNASLRDYSLLTKAEFDKISTPDARRLYKSNPSFRKRADHFWGGGK